MIKKFGWSSQFLQELAVILGPQGIAWHWRVEGLYLSLLNERLELGLLSLFFIQATDEALVHPFHLRVSIFFLGIHLLALLVALGNVIDKLESV